MADNADDSKGSISGQITPEEIKADQKANAEQDTRPNMVLADSLRVLRNQAGKHRK